MAKTGPIRVFSAIYYMNSARERLSFLLNIELQSFRFEYASVYTSSHIL